MCSQARASSGMEHRKEGGGGQSSSPPLFLIRTLNLDVPLMRFSKFTAVWMWSRHPGMKPGRERTQRWRIYRFRPKAVELNAAARAV